MSALDQRPTYRRAAATTARHSGSRAVGTVLAATCSCWFVLALASGPAPAAESSWSYPYGDAIVEFALETDSLAVRLREWTPDPRATVRAAAQPYRQHLDPDAVEFSGCARLWWIPVRDSGALAEDDLRRLCERLDDSADIEFATPVLHYRDAVIVTLPEILVQLESSRKPSAVSESPRLQATPLTLLREFPSLDRTCLFRFDRPPHEAFAIARQVAAEPGVLAAQPNMLMKLQSFGVPDDTLFGSQWTLRNLGQNGIPGTDIDALQAWQWTTGSPDTVIAIIDEGVDVDHPDLAPNMLPGYDATDQPSPGGLPGNALDIDPHGTTCAGIAAAAGNNGLGVTGVSWHSRLLPVRVGYASFWTQTSWVVDAITWSADHGADVLSNSWGGSPPSVLEQNAVSYAQTVGRGGLGCVVLFATGNSNTSVAFPAAYPEVIAIGATSPCDERKSFTSCDGQTWWGSNFGPEIDLVAPGPVSWTTDLPGSLGFGNGDYVAFTGTSAACPHVAGAVALLFSLIPTLPATEVRALLESTSEDLVGIPSEDTPGWDPHMGWGRLNAGALLDAAALSADPPVTQLTCVEAQGTVTLNWSLGTSYSEIRVRRGLQSIATLPGDATTFVELGAPPGVKVYSVQGLNPQSGSVPVHCSTGAVFLRGDTDANAGINLPDVIVLLQHLFVTPGLTCLDAGDVDDSGSINLVDAVFLLGYLFAGGPPPPPPFGVPDVDPTPDSLGCG